MRGTHNPETDTHLRTTASGNSKMMEVARKVMLLEDRVADLERGEPAKLPISTKSEEWDKQDILIGVALLTALAVFLVTTIMVCSLVERADNILQITTGSSLSSVQRMLYGSASCICYVLYLICAFVWARRAECEGRGARSFCGFILTSIVATAFSEVLYRFVAFTAA